MNCSQKDLRELCGILADIERAERYLLRPDVAGIAHVERYPVGSSHTIRNPDCLKVCAGSVEHVTVMNKQAGSDIVFVYSARARLKDYIEKKARAG